MPMRWLGKISGKATRDHYSVGQENAEAGRNQYTDANNAKLVDLSTSPDQRLSWHTLVSDPVSGGIADLQRHNLCRPQ